MGKTLVIVESPAKSKTIQSYLGNGFIVKASMGHVRDLPSKELGVDIDAGFKPTYEVSDTRGVVKNLKETAKSADKVLLASDPDREGEAIAWHLQTLLKRDCSNIARIEFNEITKDSVNKAVQNPHSIDMDLVNSQQARRILDRIVGYQLSPWLSNTIQGRLSAGRVQSVALRIIADREREISNFNPQEYWELLAELSVDADDIPFQAKLSARNGDKIQLHNQDDAQSVVSDLSNVIYRVEKIERKKQNRSAKPPFTTSTLQQEGGRKLKWDSAKVMKVAQGLYEGVDMGSDGRHGLITYMRTDSTRINPDFQRDTLSYIANKYGSKYSPSRPNTYKSKGDAHAQDAHEAIRPSSINREPESIEQYLSNDQYRLYKLIWDRFIASQMAPAEYDTQTIHIQAGNYTFRANGYAVVFDGFMHVYLEDKDVEDDKNQKDEREKRLPLMSEGQILTLEKLDPQQKFTKPPAKFTEPTLIKTLEELGIGRPSTYATIISVLKKREYVRLDDKSRFRCTQLGFRVVDALVQYFPDVMDVTFTSSMEDKLDVVAEGKHNWVDVLREFYNPFHSALLKAMAEVPVQAEQSVQTRDEPCPKCGQAMVLKNGRNGKFWACSGYPNCTNTEPFIEPDAPTCEKCGRPMVVRKGKNGLFLACTGYPECTNAKNVGGSSLTGKGSGGDTIRGNCKCGGEIVEDTKCYRCKSCGTRVWKNGLEYRGKKSIGKTEASSLLAGKAIEVQLVSKSNQKPYDATITLESDGKLKVEPKFARSRA